MHRFNVATFVYVFIVGLAATTVALFIWGTPKDDVRVRTNRASESVAVVEREEVDENETIVETSLRESDGVEEEIAASTDFVAAEENGLDSLFLDDASAADVEASADESVVAEETTAPEVVDLDSVFAEGAITADAETSADDADAAEEATEPEVVDLDSLFAEDAISADAEASADDADAAEEATESEVVDLDSLFAEDAISADVEASADDADVAEEATESEVVDLDSLFAEDAISADVEASADDADAAEEATESEVVDLDSVFAEDAISADAEDFADETVVAEETQDLEVVDLDSIFAEEASAVDAEASADEAIVAEETTESQTIAADVETVEADVEVAAEADYVDLDSIFVEDATDSDGAAVVADEALESETVAVEEATDLEVVDFDSVWAEEPAAADDALKAEDASADESVELAVVDAIFADEAVETSESEAVAAVETSEPEAVAAVETPEPEAVAAVETPESEAVAAVETSESEAVAAVETSESEAVAAVETPEPEAVAAVETSESEAVAAVETPELEAVAAVESVEPETVVAIESSEPETVEPEGIAVSSAAGTKPVEAVALENADAKARENEFWILGQAGNGFYLYRLENGAWVAKNAADFYADAAEFANVVYAHGYQTDMTDATRDAVAFKTVLDAARRNVAAKRAFRLVVWKWDSERDAARIRIDAQSKAALADWSGKALGRFLGGLDADADLTLVGFSFGARVVGSALETLAQNGAQAAAFDVKFDENADFAFAVSGKNAADGDATEVETPAVQAEVAEPYLNEAVEERKIALILVAAACDLGAFETRGVYGRGANLPTDVLNVYNPNDFALKYYRHVSETRSDAQGVAPLRAGVFPNAVGKTFNINSNPALGKRHAFVDAIGTVPTQTLGALAF